MQCPNTNLKSHLIPLFTINTDTEIGIHIIAMITFRMIFLFLSAAGDSEVLSDHRRLLPAVRGVGQKGRECLFSLRRSLLFKIQMGASHRETHSAGLHCAQFVRGKRDGDAHKVRRSFAALGGFWSLLKQNVGMHSGPHCSTQAHQNT